MSNSRPFMSIEDHLLEEFTNETFYAKDAKVTGRGDGEIYVKCTTRGWQDRSEEFEIEDEITYRYPNGYEPCISTDFSLDNSTIKKYYRFLLDNDVNPILDLLRLERIQEK